METERLDTIRHNVLDRMERAERGVRLAIFGAALTELAPFGYHCVGTSAFFSGTNTPPRMCCRKFC